MFSIQDSRQLYKFHPFSLNQQSPCGEDPLEKEMVTHSSILAWRIPWKEEPDGLQSMGSQRIRQDFTFTFTLPAPRNNGITSNFVLLT